MDVDIRSATATDLDGVVRVLTAAFATDPILMWAFPDDGTRERRVAGLWRFMAAEGYLPRGASTLVPGPDAAALWLAPGDSLDDDFWAPRLQLFVEALDGDVARISALGDAMSAVHPTDQPHWYLLAIGVTPSRQGNGLGGALIAHTLAQADAGGTPAYLEATSVRSRVLYERLGYETMQEVTVEDSPPMWPMWRQPVER